MTPTKTESGELIAPVFRWDLILLYCLLLFMRGGGTGKSKKKKKKTNKQNIKLITILSTHLTLKGKIKEKMTIL